MDQPFAHSLSFGNLEVFVLVEDGGASMARSLRRDEPFTTAAFAASLGVAVPNAKG